MPICAGIALYSLTAFYTVPTAFNVLSWRAVLACIPACVRSYVTKCTILYYEQTAGPRSTIFVNICMLTGCVRQPIVIEIVNVLDLRFKGQRFESSTL